MPPFFASLKHVARRLSRAPMFTAVTLVTLAIGIGANAAIFTVISGVLLRPLPFPEPDRLIGVWHSAPGLGFHTLNASPSTYLTYREENRTFEDIGLYNEGSVTVTGLAEPEQVRTLWVTERVIPLLGVQPALGRPFNAAEDTPTGPESVILTDAFWHNKFAGDREAIGKRLLIDGTPCEIIGVMPRSFRFLDADPMIIRPLRIDRAKVFVGNFSYESVARLRPGVTLAQANADVDRMIPMMLGKFPLPPGFDEKMLKNARLSANLHPLKNDAIGDVGGVLWVLMGTVGIVLLIACANVANLFLVRAEGRQQELAIRAALGAGWGRIARDMLAESVVLGVAGGTLGLALAYGGIQLLIALEPSSIPRLGEIRIDAPVIAFTVVVSILAGLLFGLIPVFKHAGGQIASALKGSGRGNSDSRERHRARGALVVFQVALAVVLLVSSGLMIRTFRELRKVHPGFRNPENVLTMRISIPETLVPGEEQAVRTHEAMLHRIEQVPGVTNAALTSSVTMDGFDSNDPSFMEDFPPPQGQLPPMRRYKWISPGYFTAMGNPLIAGRDITWDDIYGMRPVVVISENFAREYWKDDPRKALGRRLRERPNGTWREIVGIVAEERDNGVHEKAPAILYWPMRMSDFWDFKTFARRDMAYVIRSNRAGTTSFASEVRNAVWSVNNSVPLARLRMLTRIYERSMARTSFALVMLGLASGMALLLGVIGIYGVIAYAVAQRTREIGIRMALGAQQRDVRRMFMAHGFTLTAIGVAIGLLIAALLTRLMAALLFGVSPVDPLTYMGVSAALAASALFASYLPARRATAIDPATALRAE